MPEPISQQAAESVFKNPETAAKVVDFLVRDKPLNHGPRSISPYYNEDYARQIQGTLDAIMADGRPRQFKYSDYKNYKPRTLYAKINQSIKYLCDMLDTPDGKYKTFYSKLDISAKTGVGITIEIRKIEPFAGVVVAPLVETPVWRRNMDAWIAEAQVGGEPFHQKRLVLTEQQVDQLKAELAQCTSIIGKITAFEIKLVKINPPV